jgi:pimeloyl-ACP methyl ester carboxylesterase
MLLITPASITFEGRSSYLDELNRRTADLGIVSQQRQLLRSGLRMSNPTEFRKRVFQLTVAPYLQNPERTHDVTPFQISHRVREAVWRSLGDYDLTRELSKLSANALVIHGRHDPIPLSSSRSIAHLLNARLEIFEDSGHMPFFEEQQRFLEVAEEFLASSNDSAATAKVRKSRIDDS